MSRILSWALVVAGVYWIFSGCPWPKFRNFGEITSIELHVASRDRPLEWVDKGYLDVIEGEDGGLVYRYLRRLTEEEEIRSFRSAFRVAWRPAFASSSTDERGDAYQISVQQVGDPEEEVFQFDQSEFSDGTWVSTRLFEHVRTLLASPAG